MEAWKSEMYYGELYHHGILGMHWGKKNGPPYPLDAEDHSSSEKKAGYKKSLNGKNPEANVIFGGEPHVLYRSCP